MCEFGVVVDPENDNTWPPTKENCLFQYVGSSRIMFGRPSKDKRVHWWATLEEIPVPEQRSDFDQIVELFPRFHWMTMQGKFVGKYAGITISLRKQDKGRWLVKVKNPSFSPQRELLDLYEAKRTVRADIRCMIRPFMELLGISEE